MEQGCWQRGGGLPPAWAGLAAAARMDGGTGMPVAGGGGRRCPMSPLWVTAAGLGPAVRPLGRNGVSLSPLCHADSTAGQIPLEHLPSCDTGQGHLCVPRATCMPPCRRRTPCLLHLNVWGLDPALLSGGSQRAPPRHTQTLCTPQRATTYCKHHPEPRLHKEGVTTPVTTPGMLLATGGPWSWLSRVQLQGAET